VAGDLFDGPHPSPAAVGQVQAGLKRLADRGIVPVVLPGTHDNVVSADSVYRSSDFPGAVILQQPSVTEPVEVSTSGQKVFLYGFAYRSSASEGSLEGMQRRSEDGIHIGLLHGSREGSPEWEYRKKDLPFTLPLLKRWKLDYVALGHYHDFEELSDGARVYACYPGSPEGKRFGENGPRYCALVTIEHGRAGVEKVVSNTRVLEERDMDLSGCENEADAATAIAALGRPDLLLRLQLTGIVEAPLNLERLLGRVGGEFFHLELRDATRLFDSDYAQRIAREETIRGVFVRRARELAAQSSPERRAVVEEAFREVLVRFRAFGGKS
jgi:DNA repair exonuclease SbcCD nuclease subunit